MAICPKCGSHKFRYELRSAGTTSRSNYYRTHSRKSWFFPVGQTTRSSKRHQKSVGICPDCGYVKHGSAGLFNFEEYGCLGSIVVLAFFLALLPILIPIGLVVFTIRLLTNDFPAFDSFGFDRKKRIIALIILWVIAIIAGKSIYKSWKTELAEQQRIIEETYSPDGIWRTLPTPLEDFDYFIKDKSIYLKEYNGDDNRVYIAPTYSIEGNKLPVVSLDGTFALREVESVIVPEGVKEMSDNVFNSCGVKYIYLPKSLKTFNGWDYFQDVEKLYYGGDSKAMREICDKKREDLDIKRIIGPAKIKDLQRSDKST